MYVVLICRAVRELTDIHSGHYYRYYACYHLWLLTLTVNHSRSVPTKEMYQYASLASLGDDVYHEPSTIALEAHMAKITGKEAALFVPSGTMSNQLALRTHLKQPPYSVLCDHRAHIHKYEQRLLGTLSDELIF